METSSDSARVSAAAEEPVTRSMNPITGSFPTGSRPREASKAASASSTCSATVSLCERFHGPRFPPGAARG